MKCHHYFLTKREKRKEYLGENTQISHEKPAIISTNQVKPTLIRNKGDNFTGSPWALNYDLSQKFKVYLEFSGKKYRIYGQSIGISHLDLGGGSSGSLLLNDKKQIAGIYFGVDGANNELGLAQLLRWKPETYHNDEARSVAYDLIFGNKNTTKYYAQFVKEHKTHLYEQIKQINNDEFRFVEKTKRHNLG
ncbi:DUF31 family putative serine protease [Mycoplasmoides pneumoniae]|uniref:DUF31 family putative serine protease n=1 Tax=Mycoplasmoides pneumoniae TaxID=2104 RepID=UPI0027D95589|nr:hypothetical protein [Mycoplasmoides pneumoniae]